MGEEATDQISSNNCSPPEAHVNNLSSFSVQLLGYAIT
jgi:hypothetical protein